LAFGCIWGLLAATPPQAAERTLWGYGVRGCEAYLAAAAAADAAELTRYRDWLAGFVSAMSLALGEDALGDADLATALRGTRDSCRNDRDQDFFNAAMDFVQGAARLP
jgi:hypothetical protein